MTKKMWVTISDVGILGTIIYDLELKKMAEKSCSGKEKIKPVWVTDRDPHENVRKFISKKDKAVVDYNELEKIILIEKLVEDLKNTEGAG